MLVMRQISQIILLASFLAGLVTFSFAQTEKEEAAKEAKAAKEAVERYTIETKQNPKDANAWGLLGSAFIFQGNSKEGIKAFRKAIEIEPEIGVYWTNLGEGLLASGILDESISASRKAIELNPNSLAAWINLGGALAYQGKFKQAYDATYKATSLGPGESAAWGNHGAALQGLGRFDEANKALRKAIEIDSNNDMAMANLGGTLVKLGKFEQALEISKQAIKMNPKNTIAWNNLAGVFSAMGKDDEVLKVTRESVKFNPSDALLWANLGHTLLEKGYLDESIKASRNAVRINPVHTSAIKYLIEANRRAKHYDRVCIWIARTWMTQLPSAQAENEDLILRELSITLQTLKIKLPPIGQPSDSAIQDYYKAHMSDFSDDSVHLEMISCPKATKSRAFIDGLQNNIESDSDFKEAAQKHSDDSAAANGGDRGWVKRGDLRADLSDLAFSLKVGKVSPVIEDSSHFRIMRVVERKAGSIAPLSEVKERVTYKLKDATLKSKIRQWIRQAKKELKEAQSLQQQ